MKHLELALPLCHQGCGRGETGKKSRIARQKKGGKAPETPKIAPKMA
jgi:hypothetical protein